MKNDYPSDEDKKEKKFVKLFHIKNGEELNRLYVRSDVVLHICVFEKIVRVSFNEFDINPMYCVSLPGSTWQCGLKKTDMNLQTLQDKDLILLLQNNFSGGIR